MWIPPTDRFDFPPEVTTRTGHPRKPTPQLRSYRSSTNSTDTLFFIVTTYKDSLVAMSTIVSPRPSLSIRSPSTSNSTRPSLDLPANANASPATTAARTPPAQTQRRNRAALREFYGLKNAPAPANATGESAVKEGGSEVLSELDREGFDAEGYVKGILGMEGLEGVLRVESRLING